MAEAIVQAGLALTAAGLVQASLLPDQWPQERPELVKLVRKKRPLHTAKIAGKDALLCRAICIDVMTRSLSLRQIALKYDVGRETVNGIMQLMEERGELRPLAQTISDGLGECIVLMMLSLREALLRGEFSPAQIPIAMAALVDKKAQLDAGLVPGTNRTEAEIDESNQAAAWRALRAARAAASDSGSDGKAAQTIDVQASVPPAAALDTTLATGPTAQPAQPGPTLDLEPTTAPTTQEGGGGVAIPPPPLDARGDGPEKFSD